MSYSTEQAAKIIQMLSFVLSLFNVNVGIGNEEMTQVLAALLFAGATLYGWYKRYERGDLLISGVRKK